jgi:hypothetical protein
VAEYSTGHNVHSAKRKLKAMEKVEGVFRPMPALNFLIHTYKSMKKQVMIIMRERRKDSCILTQQHWGALGYVRAVHLSGIRVPFGHPSAGHTFRLQL